MGLFQTNENNSTGNRINVGDLIITWDENEDDKLQSEPCCKMPVDRKE